MKKLIVLLCSFGLVEASSDNAQKVIAVMYHNAAMKDNAVQFVQSAVDRFVGNDDTVKIEAEDVIKQLFEGGYGFAQLSVDDEAAFEVWASQQDKALVLLHEPHDVSCSVLAEYIRQILQKKNSTVVAVEASMHDFVQAVIRGGSSEVIEAVPNVLFIEKGFVRQLSEYDLLRYLKREVDSFL